MALELLVNHALQRSIDHHWSESDQTIQYHSALGFVGGPRHITPVSPNGTGYGRVQYANNAGLGTLNRLVVSRADLALTHIFMASWITAPWGGTVTDLFNSSNFAETLVGPKLQDYVLAFSDVTTAKGLYLSLGDGTGGAWTKKIGKVFFSEALALSNLELQYPIREPVWELVQAGSKSFLVQEKIVLKWKQVTSAQITTFLGLHLMHGDYREPFFLRDPEAFYFPETLLHVVKADHQITYSGLDSHELTLTLYVLRYYDS